MSFKNFYQGKKNNEYKPEPYRINFYIKAQQVRLFVDEQLVGVVTIEQARQIAYEKDLDLVEVTPNASPPVCKVLDYSKFKYENKIRQGKPFNIELMQQKLDDLTEGKGQTLFEILVEIIQSHSNIALKLE